MNPNLPLKTKARELTQAAIRHGQITRKPCEVCGDENSECHHVDYSDHMKVQWLCKKHHSEAHVSQRQIQSQAKLEEEAAYRKTHPAPKTVREILEHYRAAQNMSLRDFGAALSISHQQAKNYEAGQLPDRERIAGWIESGTPWVRQLGLAIFGMYFADIIHAVLVPQHPALRPHRQRRNRRHPARLIKRGRRARPRQAG